MYQDDMSDCTDYFNQPVSARFSFSFEDSQLKELYTSAKGSEAFYSQAVVKAFYKQMAYVNMASSVRDLYFTRCLKFHRLSGQRVHEWAICLTGNWRLIASLKRVSGGHHLSILRIEDYH